MKLIFRALFAIVTGMASYAGPSLADTRGVETLRAITSNDATGLSAEVIQSVRSAQAAAQAAVARSQTPGATTEFIRQQAQDMDRKAREAFVAALPPKDRALGERVLLHNSGVGGGTLLYFVSRSMPKALLRAYALEAMRTGGSLVTKGIRKGDTLKEYMQEALADFNMADNQVLSSIDINPNMFDMFQVSMVPAIVWTNKTGLDEAGSGCEDPDSPEAITLDGPNDESLVVDRPGCAAAPEASYVKITGVLNTWYALERFEQAGVPQYIIEHYRSLLAAYRQNTKDASGGLDHGLQPVEEELSSLHMPRQVLEFWRSELAGHRVQRSPFGPTFNDDLVDDEAYRTELTEKIQKGLGG